MILVIAEKPSLGRDIADALPGQVTERNNRFIRKGDYAVTWVFGHMLSLKEPEDYDMKYKKWSLDDLPIYFDSWELKMGEDSKSNRNYETKAQRVGLIGELLEESESVIHAGDPDEEGQLLIDEILRWFDYKKPVKRLNTGDTTRGGLVKALSHMTDNDDSLNEGWSAYARSVADLMIGVNMSRFFTCSNSGVLLAVGRVQTPTLGLVVKRDMQIEGHIKTVYYDIFADVNVETADGNKTVTAKYTKKKQKGAENKQITELDESEKIKNDLINKRFDNIKIEKKVVNEDPPLPFNLVKLQSYCSSHFGYNPADVMDITQSLRETHTAITYNRSDCQYLSEEHFKEASKTLAQVVQNIKFKPSELDPTIHSKCFNDKNITAHFAIIPTNNKVDLNNNSGVLKVVIDIRTTNGIGVISDKTPDNVTYLDKVITNSLEMKGFADSYVAFYGTKGGGNTVTFTAPWDCTAEVELFYHGWGFAGGEWEIGITTPHGVNQVYEATGYTNGHEFKAIAMPAKAIYSGLKKGQQYTFDKRDVSGAGGGAKAPMMIVKLYRN